MKRFQSHLDQTAFERLVEQCTPAAAVVAGQMLTDRNLAEDAVQEAFVRVVQKRRQYDPSRPFTQWFYAVLRNVCIDMLRKQRRDKQLAARRHTVAPPGNHPGRGTVAPVLDLLPAHERPVLELRVIHAMPFREIAAALGISEDVAKKRAQRGLRRLRQRLSRSDFLRKIAV